MKKLLLLAATATVLSLSPVVSFAQKSMKGSMHDTQHVNATEKLTPDQFVMRSTNGNMFEIEAGKVALEKTKNENIKEFAQKMVDDHSIAKENLSKAIEEDKLTLTVPAKLDSEYMATVEKLKSTSEAQFDKTYIAEMKKAHAKTLSLLTSYSQNGKDGAVKEFASDTIDIVKGHHDMVNKLDM